MKICIAQTHSKKGAIKHNIDFHLKFIERAIKLDSDLIIFPELSVTGYEPSLAKGLASNIQSKTFNVFQALANKHEITIGLGMPTKSETKDGILISMFIFQPFEERLVYAKQLIHTDETPFFVCGNKQTYLNIKGVKVAVGICYETLQGEHFLRTKKDNATIYIASVAKPKAGVKRAYMHFSNMALTHKTPILMVNSVGFCDNFLSYGNSAVWSHTGDLLSKLDSQNEGLIIYDTDIDEARSHSL